MRKRCEGACVRKLVFLFPSRLVYYTGNLCVILTDFFGLSVQICVQIRGTMYKCKSYCPRVFMRMRNHLFGVDEASFYASVGEQTGETTQISTDSIVSRRHDH
jgi:hypothetical protein